MAGIVERRKQIEAEHFDRAAERVGLSRGLPDRERFSVENIALNAPYEFARKWLAEHCKDKVVLDYACGIGLYSLYPINFGARKLFGIDISPKSIEVAKAGMKAAGFADKTQFEVGDCEALPYQPETFDLVFSFGNFSYLDLPKAYAEIARVLKPGGKFLVVDTLGYNPLLKLNRWIRYKRGQRSAYMKDHIVKMNAVKLGQRYFRNLEELRFYDLTTLCAVPFVKSEHTCTHAVVSTLKKIDAVLLKLPIIKYLAFKIVFVFSYPRKAPAIL